MPPIPPLPPDWPYPGRPALSALLQREAVTLPGLPGGWTLMAGDLPAAAEAEAPGAAFGRGGVRIAGQLVLRPYRRGGLVRHLNDRTYPGPGRFQAEYAVHRALWEAGAPTVEPLGWAWRRHGWGVEGVYLTRLAEGAPWPRTWDPGAVPDLARLIRALAAWGLWCPDLNATNVLVGPAGLLALDWDRARWTAPEGLADRYLARLCRSLAKLGAPDERASALKAGVIPSI